MLPDWLVAILFVQSHGTGFITAWAICHRDEPFWAGVLDGITLRFLWGRKA